MTAPPPWFFSPPEDWGPGEVWLPPDESHHAVTVMRIAAPDVITVTNGLGRVARCAAGSLKGDRMSAEILEDEERRPLVPEIVVYQAAPKGRKADDVIEGLAELGVAETWIYDSERSVVKWDDVKQARLAERWETIARSAAKRSRNPFLMRTSAGLSWRELLERLAVEPLAVVLWEESTLPMRTALAASVRVALVVGPEGGLTRSESEALARVGAQIVSLGPHILRTETAAVVCTSALLFHYGRIG